MSEVDGPKGQDLWRRADRVIPGGATYRSRSARMAGDGNLPGFIESASGCRITDVDGRSYIDFICTNGPNLLGYLHPEVEEAAQRQAKQAMLTSFFPPALVEFAERLVQRSPEFGWAIAVKNGSDATALAARVMRAATQRPLVLLFNNAYHGFEPEFMARPSDPAPADNLRRVSWNDAEAVHELARTEGERLAGVLLNPLDQNPMKPTREASPEFLAAIEDLRRTTGARLAIDDVRHGFRLHPQGSHKFLGVQPDLLCLGKALGNGHSTAALLGVEDLREPCERLFFTSTFIFDSVAFRAAMKTLEIYNRDQVFDRLVATGERLKQGFLKAADATGHQIDYSGPVTMPTLLFEDDSDNQRARRFAREAALRGAIFHPSLNWFVSAAHDDESIDQAIEIASEAFRATT